MTQDDKHAPETDPDILAAAEIGAVDEDIDDSQYVSGLPGILGVIDVAIARIEAVLLAIGVLLMAVNTSANVLGRYVFGQSIFFSEELNQALIILITFAGISYAARHGRHIRMSAFFDAMPFRMRKRMMILIAAVTSAAMLLLAWYSLDYVLAQASRGRLLPALQIPQWWIIVWAPLGFFLTGVQYALTTIKNIIDKDIWLSTSTLEGYDDSQEEEV
ncbi:TRAP transporter small permease [Paracoccus seriniphilus]|uniref:TRAP transporter small permease protein n=1 Tax=Paracoccus seriniphilus TaxID=184748 RepID=A0A239PWM4_9RHOB|nr:TRAP transporter small permease [Paracoccus seriniphilus]WCR13148.1 TRAP transporter small permease [Paracoccus seriniphilus]SNT74570.1 TRAP-type C4-dicarboxylate transport system, small permease component [Paracoccus seriniphilus]